MAVPAASPGSCPRSSVEEVSNLLMAAPEPGLKCRAALNISYGAGLRAREVCNLKISNIDSDRMLIYVEQGKSSHLRPAWRRTNAAHVSLIQLKVMSAIEAFRTAALGGPAPPRATAPTNPVRCNTNGTLS